MTKPKNPPYIEALLDCKDGVDALKKAYAAGLRDREKRLARALRRWIVENAEWDTVNGEFTAPEICGILKFLTARAKRGKK